MRRYTYHAFDVLTDRLFKAQPGLLQLILSFGVLRGEVVLQLEAGSNARHFGLAAVGQLVRQHSQKDGLRGICCVHVSLQIRTGFFLNFKKERRVSNQVHLCSLLQLSLGFLKLGSIYTHKKSSGVRKKAKFEEILPGEFVASSTWVKSIQGDNCAERNEHAISMWCLYNPINAPH